MEPMTHVLSAAYGIQGHCCVRQRRIARAISGAVRKKSPFAVSVVPQLTIYDLAIETCRRQLTRVADR